MITVALQRNGREWDGKGTAGWRHWCIVVSPSSTGGSVPVTHGTADRPIDRCMRAASTCSSRTTRTRWRRAERCVHTTNGRATLCVDSCSPARALCLVYPPLSPCAMLCDECPPVLLLHSSPLSCHSAVAERLRRVSRVPGAVHEGASTVQYRLIGFELCGSSHYSRATHSVAVLF